MRIVRSQVWLAAVAAGLVLGFASMSSASEKGKQLFVKYGCWQCHGFVGQGGITGPELAPEVMPLEAMINFVRNANRSMPAYKVEILPDADLKEIHAYLVSLPKPADPSRSRCSRTSGYAQCNNGPAPCRAVLFCVRRSNPAPAGRICSRRSRSSPACWRPAPLR